MHKRLLLVLAILLVSTAAGAKAYALVIGISDYQHLRPLPKSQQDAMDMADVLKANGFEVTLIMNPASNLQLETRLAEHFKKLKEDTMAIGLIYYSGHGTQMNGVNFLIPTQANPGTAADIETDCFALSNLLSLLQASTNRLNIVILEASHDNPLSAELKLPVGLQPVDFPKNTVAAFSAMPYSITMESHVVYTNSPKATVSQYRARSFPNHTFTYFLIQTMRKRAKATTLDGNDFKRIMNRTSYMVSENTKGAENPWFSGVPKELLASPPDKTTLVVGSSVFTNPGGGTPIPELIPPERWAKKNLSTTTFANGDPIPEARSVEEWKEAHRNMKPVWCYYNYDSTTQAEHGKLYNHYAATDPRGLATGWRLPTKAEWETLSVQLEVSMELMNKGVGAGTNDFVAVPSGFREPDGSFRRLGQIARWWTRTDYSAAHVYLAQNFIGDGKVSFLVVNKGAGYSIRLIRE